MTRDDSQDKKLEDNSRMLKHLIQKEFNPITRLYKIFALISALCLLMILSWHLELVQEPPTTYRVSITVVIGAIFGLVTFVLYLVESFMEGGKKLKEFT